METMAKRKSAKKARKGKAPKCAVVSVCGGRRRLCRDGKGRIKTNTKA